MARSPKVVLKMRPDGQEGLFAREAVERDEILVVYDGPVVDHATRYSIQIDDDRHLDGTPDSSAFINHSCDPSAYVDWRGLCLRARRAMPAGAEITCDYHTTDWELYEPFTCGCGAAACRGEIRGFKHLGADEQRALERWLPEFLKRRIPPA
ncbi:MAG TPA: SET domain-containing protein-lysine N-methyltransferase [Polyangia bacterium]|jgi:hypothetical protein